eukprot:123671_1
MVKNNKNDLNLSRQELFDMANDEAYNMEDEECPICYEAPFDEPLQTICRHIFCGECIRSILMNKPECPMCRKKCNVNQLKRPPSKNKNDKNKEEIKNDEPEKKDDDDNDGTIIFDAK